MGETVIKIENVSKQYRLGSIGTGTLSHDVNRWWHKVTGREDPYLQIGERNDRSVKSDSEYVWALRDINYEIRKGDVVGVIGRNGAGKSTLLKILSRTTTPTTGTIKIKGRIASLLEVGTGFHPELTGRQNIFLNGAILGMNRKEVTAKFDEIVAFAGVERYIDTPVKRYSSGMYVRLAFAVAAHLESEILVVDEVLAVGDAEFQKKALGKMKDVSRGQERTVLFVSHNMGAIMNLCTTAIYMDMGTISSAGAVDVQVRNYLQGFKSITTGSFGNRTDRTGSGQIKYIDFTLLDARGEKVNSLITGGDYQILLHFESNGDPIRNLSLALGIDDDFGNRITHLNNEVTNDLFAAVPAGVNSIRISIKKLPLMPGQYDVTIFSNVNGVLADWIQKAFSFVVDSGDFYNTGRLIPAGQGSFLVEHRFNLE